METYLNLVEQLYRQHYVELSKEKKTQAGKKPRRTA